MYIAPARDAPRLTHVLSTSHIRCREMRTRLQFSDRTLLVGAIMALTTAATLVGYLEYQSDERQRGQNRVIVQQVCERTAAVVAGRIRHLLDIAVLETIEGIGHGQINDKDVPRVATSFASGLKRHPYVDQFFLWSANRSEQLPDQVVFYSPVVQSTPGATPVVGPDHQSLGAFVSEPNLGREILRVAQSVAGPRTFEVVDRVVDGTEYKSLSICSGETIGGSSCSASSVTR